MEGERGAAPAPGPGRSADGSSDNSAAHFACIDTGDLQGCLKIGVGGFGEVYRAQHRVWRIQLAVKFGVRQNGSDEHELLEEAKKLHKAQFEYILRLYGITKFHPITGTKSLGLVTAYVENGSLEKLIHHHDVRLPLRLRFVYEIALGMNFLHNLSPALYHHDLKPANILLDKDYHIKICDFGLAKWRKLTSEYTNDSCKNNGTLSYMPPECLDNINTKKDKKFDVYSYGIVIWEILTCQEPYKHALHSEHIKVCVSNGNRPDLDEIPPKFLEPCKTLINLMKRCWAQNPQDRPPFSSCVNELEPQQRNKQELQQAVQSLTQQSNDVVVDSAPGSGGDMRSCGKLCEPVEEQNKSYEPVQESAQKECKAETCDDTSREGTMMNPIEERNECIEPVQECTQKGCKADVCHDASREEIMKNPLLVVKPIECLTLAKFINKDWKALGRYLGLTNEEIVIIEYDHHSHGLVEIVYQMLCKWKQQQGHMATRAQLVQGLKEIQKEHLWKELWS